MKQQDHPEQGPRLFPRLAAAAATLTCLGLLAASPASASFEQVGCFAGGPPGEPCKPVKEEKFTEEAQLGGVGGMAVNYTGAGGVPAGTVYATNFLNGGLRIAMFEPKAGGDLEFRESWQVRQLEEPYGRCGPELGVEIVEGQERAEHPCAPQASSGRAGSVDVEVDQATGNVYAFNGEILTPGRKMIVVYTPDGAEEITRFGEFAEPGKATAETPGQIHQSTIPGGIAINAAGDVYVFDRNPSDRYHRLMEFVPKVPGKYDAYEYAGTAADVAAGFLGEGLAPERPVADAAGHIYVAPEDNRVEEYDPANPKAPPVCRFEYPKGGIQGMTVDPKSGEAFFFSFRIEKGFKSKTVRRLGPCDEATGKFAGGIVEEFEVKPERNDLFALTFDPVRKFSPTRGAGVLYGGAPGPQPSLGAGTGEPGQSALGYIFAPTEETPPAVEAESVAHVTGTSADLGAQINPKGHRTDYVFQYITESAFQEGGESFAGASEAPLGGALLGEGQETLDAGITLLGLQPDTAYRYRAVATSHCSPDDAAKVCEDAGPAQAFRTFPLEAPSLPDQRAYELVSPTDKDGGQVLPAFPGISSCGSESECKPGNFATHFPMQSSPDGEAVVYEGTPFSPSEGAVNENQYISRRNAKTGWQTVNLTPSLLSSRGGEGYKAFDRELDRGVFGQSIPALSPEALPSGYSDLYAQPTNDPLALSPLLSALPPNRPGGSFAIKYAGISADGSRIFFKANDALTAETPFAPEAKDGRESKYNLYEWAEGQLALVNVKPDNTETEAGVSTGPPSTNAISADGSRVFWSDEAGHVYVRINGESTKAIPDSGKFLSASVDGSKVLLTNGHLYDLETETTTDLTGGKGGFQGIAGQSDDLSHVYFVDTEVLSGEEANSEGAKAQTGKFNLYAWSEGASRFVATLVAKDNEGTNLAKVQDWTPTPSLRTAEASPNGRFLAFGSVAPLTGYDNVGPCETDNAGGFIGAPCPEVFLYDSATGELTCASCNPTGVAPPGPSVLRLILDSAAQLPQPRYLTDQGRLYFDSRDSLVLGDTNEGVEDVYQYEPNEMGSCKREGGCVSLISAGSEPVDSNFLTIDETGKDVFFTTRDQLVLKDKDDLIDLYDAREGGGIPGETEVARSECQGEACQPAISPPNDPTPGSSSFEGAGNVNEKKPAKKHAKKHKKHKSKAHAKKHKRAANNNRGGAK